MTGNKGRKLSYDLSSDDSDIDQACQTFCLISQKKLNVERERGRERERERERQPRAGAE